MKDLGFKPGLSLRTLGSPHSNQRRAGYDQRSKHGAGKNPSGHSYSCLLDHITSAGSAFFSEIIFFFLPNPTGDLGAGSDFIHVVIQEAELGEKPHPGSPAAGFGRSNEGGQRVPPCSDEDAPAQR